MTDPIIVDVYCRKTAHLIILVNEMEDYNIALYTAKEVLDGASSGSLLRLLTISAAELEREKALANNLTDSNLD
jgi:hypothetical protein